MKPNETPAQSITPREARAFRRAESARELQRSLLRHDVSQREVADYCGVDRQVVTRWCDPNEPHTPCLAALRQLCHADDMRLNAVGLDMLRWCEPIDVEDTSVLTHEEAVAYALTLIRNETAACTIDAVKDGVISADEADAIDRHADALIAAAASLKAKIALVKRSRGTVLRPLQGGK